MTQARPKNQRADLDIQLANHVYLSETVHFYNNSIPLPLPHNPVPAPLPFSKLYCTERTPRRVPGSFLPECFALCWKNLCPPEHWRNKPGYKNRQICDRQIIRRAGSAIRPHLPFLSAMTNIRRRSYNNYLLLSTKALCSDPSHDM